MGLWLVQECRARCGRRHDYDELHRSRAEAPRPTCALFDPDDEAFLAPGDMPARIAAACERTGQPAARRRAARRCARILVSLACKYRCVLEQPRARRPAARCAAST